MAKRIRERKRSKIGYGSSYRMGGDQDLAAKSEIPVVLGGQVWMVKPDKRAAAANPCIWMQTGVVEFKNCNNFYDCTKCKYDLGMLKVVEKGKQISWQDAMRKRPGLERICRHSLTNRIKKRACAYNYECSKCDFDQFFEDVWTAKTKSIPSEVQEIKGFEVPVGHYFHNGHTWARIESGGYIRIGMDDFALKLLGKADAFDLPLMGKELDQDNVGWGLRRKEYQADVLSPVDGVIMEVNSNVRENAKLVNKKPYEDGWLFMVRTPDIKDTVKRLMDDTGGMEWMNREVNRLENMIEEVAGPLAADGGFLGEDIYGSLPELGWKRLTKTFLRT
ncbi:MAG: glycine cleavage system protein H [Deltaproteobacteria bacterium]|nr:glycine cleavage system protein H [Deltaproteobacteria bacterium]MBW1738263.1 glycine cleavage system protein H [Deltaproteobacteria bacterium]MBW1908720.1 glycine cleavage system protein H [Deltaproteobacteria bacterium]MBW2033850.1 glycine cleavage system protein H [Deltaproteobacteria bacterium]MBW2115572.1 glycine cleavage system protein H [Deltaproteobacteria bacterium]